MNTTCTAPRCIHLSAVVTREGMTPTCLHSGQQKPFLACTWHTTPDKARAAGNRVKGSL